jgi:hypothetical protein
MSPSAVVTSWLEFSARSTNGPTLPQQICRLGFKAALRTTDLTHSTALGKIKLIFLWLMACVCWSEDVVTNTVTWQSSLLQTWNVITKRVSWSIQPLPKLSYSQQIIVFVNEDNWSRVGRRHEWNTEYQLYKYVLLFSITAVETKTGSKEVKLTSTTLKWWNGSLCSQEMASVLLN